MKTFTALTRDLGQMQEFGLRAMAVIKLKYKANLALITRV